MRQRAAARPSRLGYEKGLVRLGYEKGPVRSSGAVSWAEGSAGVDKKKT